MKRITIAATIVLLASFLVSASANAQAGPGHYSRGDAEAVLRAYPTGGNAILLHAPHVLAGPSLAGADDLSIRPISPYFSGARYCVADWHAIALAFIDGEHVVHFEEPLNHTKRDAFAFLGALATRFFLDQAAVEGTSQSPIQPYFDLEFVEDLLEAFYVQAGGTVAPDALSVGEHTLSATIDHPEFGIVFDDGITFYVDPPQSDTCLHG